MARKTKSAEVVQESTAVQEIVQAVADSTRMPDTSFDPSQFDKPAEQPQKEPERQPGDEPTDRWAKAVGKMAAKRFAGAIDEAKGVRVDIEAEPVAGLPYARVLISFSEKPSKDETQLLKDNGFKWGGDSWQIRKSAANTELALRLVNEVKKGRGDEGRGFYV